MRERATTACESPSVPSQQANHGVAGGEIVRISLTKIKISPEKKLYLRILEFEDTMIFHN